MQITDTIMMIRPANFTFNHQTAENNAFQSKDSSQSDSTVSKKAIIEFDNMVELLRSKGVEVVVIQDTEEPKKPDAVFPNNWISFHGNGALITYPMFAPNRRIERREDIIDHITSLFNVEKRYTFDHYEDEEMYLEGTGSMLLDRDNNLVYACLSDRTDIRLLDKFAVLTDYNIVAFHSVDKNGEPIYHTNVMMALGEDFSVLVEESITDGEELAKLKKSLKSTNKEIISINYKQMESFAGNMLQVKGKSGKKYLVMSESAYKSLNEDQIDRLSSFNELLPVNIDTIEYYGGGSVRCMMAEIFLDKI